MSASPSKACSYLLHPLALLVYFAAIWEAVSRMGWIDPFLLPSFTAVMAKLRELLTHGDLLKETYITLTEAFLSFVIAVPIGIAIGFVLAENRFMGQVFKPFFNFLFSIPKSIFLPMFILGFGIGFGQKVAYGIFSTIFIVVISMAAVAESVRYEFKLVARCYRATPMQQFFYVYLPAMLPGILETLRLAMIFNFTGIILAEMYASRAGVGKLIANWGESYMLPELLAGVIFISAIAIVFNEVLRAFEAKYSQWKAQ